MQQQTDDPHCRMENDSKNITPIALVQGEVDEADDDLKLEANNTTEVLSSPPHLPESKGDTDIRENKIIALVQGEIDDEEDYEKLELETINNASEEPMNEYVVIDNNKERTTVLSIGKFWDSKLHLRSQVYDQSNKCFVGLSQTTTKILHLADRTQNCAMASSENIRQGNKNLRESGKHMNAIYSTAQTILPKICI